MTNKIIALMISIPLVLGTSTHNLEDLIEAMTWVESRGDPNAYNRREDAIGVLQIRSIMIDEVNRLLRLEGSSTRYIHDHAWDENCSHEILGQLVRLKGYKDPEVIARVWNGGYNGMRKESTKAYWSKVKNRLTKIKKK